MNYYDVLRVDKNASAQEIRDSYKKLIKRYHPDLYPGNKVKAEAITRDLNEAYEVLSNPGKKELYDLSLEEPIIEHTSPQTETVSNSYQDYTQNITNKENKENIENEQNNFQEKLRKNIHTFVDNQSEKMSPNSKYKIILIVFFIALLIFLLTTKDFIDFQFYIQERHNQQELNVTTQP